MRTIFTIIAIVLAWLISLFPLWVNPWLGLVVFLALMGLFIVSALPNIPADPPHKAVLMFLGKRLNVVLDEGWNWVPFYPFIFSFVLVMVKKITSKFGPQEVRTPDGAVISTSEAVIWRPGIEGKPVSLINYLNSGGEAGVVAILQERVGDRVKTWGTSNQEGPATWKEAQGLRDDAHAVLAKALLGGVLSSIDPKFQDVPTSTWMRFLNEPKSSPTAYDLRFENGGWASIDAQGHWSWPGLEIKFNAYSIEEREALKKQVNARREDVNALRGAKGKFPDESLGITILGFSVNEIQGEGEVARAAEKEEKERLEMKAETMEMDNVAARAKALMAALPGLTADQALQVVQTERGKVKKTIVAVSGAKTDIGSDLLGLVAAAKEYMTGGGIKLSSSGGGNNPQRGGKDGDHDDDSDDDSDDDDITPKRGKRRKLTHEEAGKVMANFSQQVDEAERKRKAGKGPK